MSRQHNFPTSQEEILDLRALFQRESDLEREEFQMKMDSVPLKTRIETGVSLHPLEVKETEFFFGETWKVHLTPRQALPRFHSFHPGTPVSLFRGEERKYGSLQRLSDTDIVVLVEGEIPDWLEEGNVGIDLFYTEKTFKEGDRALERVLEDKPNTSWKRELLLGYKDQDWNPDIIPEGISSSIQPGFNPSQKEAILAILGNRDAMVIQGPPGTGKTSILVEAIRLLVAMGKKVLVSTPTNSSLDLILEKILPTRIEPVRIGQMTRVSDNLIPYTMDYIMDRHSMSKSVAKFKKEANNLRKKAYKFHRNFDAKKREERNEAQADYKGILETIRNTERHIGKDIISKHNPVLATNVSASSSILNKERFDVCILDEATQSLEPVAWIPLLRAESIVLTGDKNQLPPTVMSEDKRLLETLFIKASETFYNTNRYYLLNIQYRMEEEILGFSNQEFYEGKVNTDKSVLERSKIYEGIFRSGIVFIDTAGTGFEEERSEESESIKNTGEAKTISSILGYLQPSLSIPLSDIGVIAPYKEQVYAIREALTEEMSGVEVSTVDSFQGREKEIILISLTRSNDSGDIGFLKDYRRMNVSLTRGRRLLIVVGDSTTLSQDAFYSRFLDYVRTKGDYRSAYEYTEI